MTSQHVELAQQLIRNPGKLLTPAEKAAKGRKKMPMKQPDLDKVEAVYSQKVSAQRHALLTAHSDLTCVKFWYVTATYSYARIDRRSRIKRYKNSPQRRKAE